MITADTVRVAGIVFADFFPLFRDIELASTVIHEIAEFLRAQSLGITVIAGLDSRGFVVGPLLARELGVGFIPVRKAGKLPGAVLQKRYALEYGTAEAEVQRSAVAPGSQVLLVDDLLATGGTLAAAEQLLTEAGATVVGALVILALPELSGAARLGVPIFTLVECFEEAGRARALVQHPLVDTPSS